MSAEERKIKGNYYLISLQENINHFNSEKSFGKEIKIIRFE
jgi:hypothetical protein